MLRKIGSDTFLLSDGKEWHANRLVKAQQRGGAKGHGDGLREWQFLEAILEGKRLLIRRTSDNHAKKKMVQFRLPVVLGSLRESGLSHIC